VDGLVGLVALAVALSIVALVSSAQRRAQLAVWRAAAARAGLADVEEAEGGLFEGAFLAGRHSGVGVRLESYRKGRYEHGTRIVIDGIEHGAGSLSLRREGLSTAFEKRFIGEREIEIGDPSFDAEYYVEGQAPLALALLDPETRRRVSGLLRGRVAVAGSEPVEVDASLAEGVLEVRVKESGFSGIREHVPEILVGVLEVARLLVAPKDVPARIAANLGRETESGARLAGLLMLSSEFPQHPATREALLAARGDPSEEVRLRAGIALGEDGRDTLVDLVRRIETEDACAARAAAALGEHLPNELATETLRRALGGAGSPQTAQACLEALGRRGRPEQEGLMLEALAAGDAPVSLAAARALGRVGTVAAVTPLREAAERGGEHRHVARKAITEIQARLNGAEPGQLTLAAGEAGGLSLAAGDSGRLSLAEGEGRGLGVTVGEGEAEGEKPPRGRERERDG
jgi:HEAT repeat protein